MWGGTLVYTETANAGPDKNGNTVTRTNEFLHMVIAVAGHEIDSFEQFYVNDTPVTLDGNGFVTDSAFNLGGDSFVRIKAYTGTDTQTADPLLVAEGPNWTANHRLRGIAYIYARLRWDPNIWPNGIPSINAVVKGKKVYDPRSGLTAWSNNAALCVRDYLYARDAGNVPYGFREHGNNVDAEDVHDFLKDRVGKLKQHFITPEGEVLTGPGSTAKLTTTEFEDYLAKVRAWAAETLDLTIPMPNEKID